jgi:16S rRNA G1207 methylase RsmC
VPQRAVIGHQQPAAGVAVEPAARRQHRPAQALAPRGRLWLVANRHLPYVAALGAHFAQVRTVAQEGGFKVVEAVRGAA